jgi:hypothetical protein
LNRNQFSAVLVAGLFLHIACTGSSTDDTSGTGIDITQPAPVATATAAPTAAPPAAPSELCANGNWPATSFDIKVYTVKALNGELRDFDPSGPFYVGERVRFDSQGKDKFGRRTNGCGEPRWDWFEDAQGMLDSDKTWQPVARVLAEGQFFVTANHDHTKAREGFLVLNFLPAAASPIRP